MKSEPPQAAIAASPLRGRSPYAAIAPRLPQGETLTAAALLAQPRAELELEIGPGRGTFLFERAAACPGVGLIGVEVRLKWATLVDDRLKSEGLGDRCRVFAEDMRVALPRFADGLFRRIFIHFPDPWWKKRHAKRRLASAEPMAECVRVLARGGELFVQTDVEEAVTRYRGALDTLEALAPNGDTAGEPWLAHNPYNARSPREYRAMRDGLPIHRLRYVRR
jgi:tRNA (guanine-N7-)-methyltransferase